MLPIKKIACLSLVLAVVALMAAVSAAGGWLSGTPAAGSPDGPTPSPGVLPGIVFVGAPMFDEQTDGGTGVYQGAYHWRDSYIYARSATYHASERTMGPVRPGRNLYALVPARPDGKLTRLTHLKSGAVFKPEPHCDGHKVLFAMRRDGEDWFHQYEVNIDGTGLKQLTDGPFNDFAGVYLPDGRIVFCSDRTGYLEEYHEERTETLFVMNGNGTGLRQITFLPGTYFEPTVLRDGRILFSFWDAFHIDVPPFDKHETILMTVHPDGTEERHLFGSGQYRFFHRERHSGIGLTQAREMADGKILVQSEMGPSLLDLEAGLQVEEALTPIFPGTTSIQLGGTTHRAHLSPLGTRSTAYPLADGRFLFSGTHPGARDSAIYVCDPQTRQTQLVYNIPNYAEFDAVPVLVKRPRPKILPTRIEDRGSKVEDRGKLRIDPRSSFLVVAGHVSDNLARAEALKKARFFRVVEAEYTGVTTSSHTNLQTRILGVVPIHPDGSAYFEAPADTPIFLDPLDAAGNRVLMEWTYPNTSVELGTHYPATQMTYMSGRPGETRSCYGCHASQTDAVPNVTLAALKSPPVQVVRTATDLEYRRNDPEAYRTQARVGEAGKYVPWLKSTDPVRKARACVLLMYIEDGAEPAVPTIAGLLRDKSVEVRRAAALALTRLGGEGQRQALLQAQKDADSQVALIARAAVEALDGLPVYWDELKKEVPDVRAFRNAGKKRDTGAVPRLVPRLKKHKWEYHAAEAAVALGRIGTPEAVDALWAALRSEVPLKQVHISRYLQQGPRPEEYALLKGLILARARVALSDIHLLIALLPNTFMEKPRYEDALRDETQRALMPRLLLERAGYRKQAVRLLVDALKGQHPKNDPLYQQLLKGVNLERPFSEHGRPFPVVQKLGPEECLWLLNCLLEPAADIDTPAKRQELEDLVVPLLTATNPRERIDAANLLGKTGFGSKTARMLAVEAAKAYAFPEITSIGQGMPGTPLRDKAYLVQALARHIDKVEQLKPFANARTMYRDIRYGLVRGLARRGQADALPLLGELATRDPLTVIRTEARQAIATIQDSYRLVGKEVPQVQLREPQPLEALYPPRGLKWADTTFRDLPSAPRQPPRGEKELEAFLRECWQPKNFRNLNMAQAMGANQIMIAQTEETRLAFEQLARWPTAKARPLLLAALDSPSPYAHYLAAHTLGQTGDKEAIPVLVRKLDEYSKRADTVGFWWTCEALGRLKTKEAVPVLARHAIAGTPPGTQGPVGMAEGYIAARTLGQILVDANHPEIARLLGNENVWLRAGALRGLAEVRAPGVENLLQQATQAESPALVRYEAQIQLRRLR